MGIRNCACTCEAKRFLPDPLAQREDIRINLRRPVIDAIAGQADGVGVDRAGVVIGISNDIVAAIIAVIHRYATRRHDLIAEDCARRHAANTAYICADKGIAAAT